jgi:hypothetical protein
VPNKIARAAPLRAGGLVAGAYLMDSATSATAAAATVSRTEAAARRGVLYVIPPIWQPDGSIRARQNARKAA